MTNWAIDENFGPTFGLTVNESFEFDEDYNQVVPNGEFSAYLPHQCDSWEIAEGEPSSVLAALERFRDEISRAIEELKKRTDR